MLRGSNAVPISVSDSTSSPHRYLRPAATNANNIMLNNAAFARNPCGVKTVLPSTVILFPPIRLKRVSVNICMRDANHLGANNKLFKTLCASGSFGVKYGIEPRPVNRLIALPTFWSFSNLTSPLLFSHIESNRSARAICIDTLNASSDRLNRFNLSKPILSTACEIQDSGNASSFIPTSIPKSL